MKKFLATALVYLIVGSIALAVAINPDLEGG